MALIKCPDCGKMISNRAEVCPNCGLTEPAMTIRELEDKSKVPQLLNVPCPYCKNSISIESIVCEYCGADIPEEAMRSQIYNSETRGYTWILVVFLIVAFVVAIIAKGCGSSDGKPTSYVSPRTVVENSSFDGSVHQVKSWLKENLKDPKSVEYLDWSPVTRHGTGYLVRVKYRAKNSYGGYSVEEKLFSLDSMGSVVSVMDY